MQDEDKSTAINFENYNSTSIYISIPTCKNRFEQQDVMNI